MFGLGKKTETPSGDSFEQIEQDLGGNTINHDTQKVENESNSNSNHGAQMGPDPSNLPPETWKLLCPVLDVTFGIWAPNWKVSKEEIELLAQAYDPLLDKYIGSHWLTGPEVAAVLVTGNIILPRIKTPRKAPPPKKPDAPETPEE